MINSRCYKLLLLFIILFIGSFNVKAEEKCSDDKINQLKKQVEKVSIVSNFDDEAYDDGVLDANVITLYDLPKGFIVTNKDQSVTFYDNELVNGSASKNIASQNGNFSIYAVECPNQALRTIKVDIKRISPYYNSVHCKGIKEGELDVCEKFYDKDISYDSFLRKVEKYKEKHNIVTKNVKKESFFKKNKLLVIGVVIGFVLVVLCLIIINNIKKNKLD